jgi:hypothetical protein
MKLSAWSRADAFHIGVGVSAIAAGGARVFLSANSGWSLLLVGLGILLLAVEWVVANRVEFEIAGPAHVVALVAAGLCVWASALYLTRGANDLPHYLPGRDGDSAHLLLVRGLFALMMGAAVLIQVIARARPALRED